LLDNLWAKHGFVAVLSFSWAPMPDDFGLSSWLSAPVGSGLATPDIFVLNQAIHLVFRLKASLIDAHTARLRVASIAPSAPTFIYLLGTAVNASLVNEAAQKDKGYKNKAVSNAQIVALNDRLVAGLRGGKVVVFDSFAASARVLSGGCAMAAKDSNDDGLHYKARTCIAYPALVEQLLLVSSLTPSTHPHTPI